MANANDPDVSHGTPNPGGDGGQGTFGTNPSDPTSIPGQSAPGSTPHPAQPPASSPATPSGSGRNTPLLVGIGVAVLAVIAVIVGLIAR